MTEESLAEGYFIVQRTPAGYPPEEIRAAWLGLALPIPFKRAIEAPESVIVLDRPEGVVYLDDAVLIFRDAAIKVLEQSRRLGAAAWWSQDTAERQNRGISTLYLVFDTSDGLILSPQAKEKYFPDLL